MLESASPLASNTTERNIEGTEAPAADKAKWLADLATLEAEMSIASRRLKHPVVPGRFSRISYQA